MNKKLFNKVLIINFVYAMPLIISQRLYADDIFRATSGWMRYWIYDARPMTFYIMKLLNLGDIASDISPLPLALSLVVMSAASCYIAKIITSKTDWITAFSASLLCLSPLYLENLSFSFDSLTMAIAIFLSVFSASYAKKLSLPVKILLIFLMLCTYQPALSVFIGVTAFIVFIDAINRRPVKLILKQTLENIISLIIGYIIYKPIIKELFPESEYFFNKGSVELEGLITTSSNNTIESLNLLFDWLGNYLTLTMLAFIISVFIVLIQNKLNFKYLFIALIGLLTILFSILGPVILTSNPVLLPRVFVGFSCFVCITFLIVNNVRYIQYTSVIIVFLSLMFMYSFNGAMKGEERRNNLITNDIISLISASKNPIDVIRISGNPGSSLIKEQAARKYHIIDYIVPNYYSTPRLANAWLLNNGVDIKVEKDEGNSITLSKTSIFFEYGYDRNVLLLKFKKPR